MINEKNIHFPLKLTLWACTISTSPFKIVLFLSIFFFILYWIPPFFFPKIRIAQDGIYIIKGNWFIEWEDIEGFSHVVLPVDDFHGRNFSILYEKTLIIHRKQYDSIVIPDVSFLTLFAIRIYSEIKKDNLIIEGLAITYYYLWYFSFLYMCYTANFSWITSLEWIFLFLPISLILKKVFIPILVYKLENRKWKVKLRERRNSLDKNDIFLIKRNEQM